MRNFKKLLSLILMLCVVLAALTACGGDADTAGTTAASGEKTTHTVNVKTAGGMPMEGVEVYVYADDTLADLKQYGETGANGTLTLEMETSEQYAITVSGAPKGYAVDASYGFAGTTADITLTSFVVADESLPGATLGLGGVMYDFSVTTPEGETVKLSDIHPHAGGHLRPDHYLHGSVPGLFDCLNKTAVDHSTAVFTIFTFLTFSNRCSIMKKNDQGEGRLWQRKGPMWPSI